MKVGVVVVNWNNATDTIECITSLQKMDFPDFFTVVVDNASTDGSETTIMNKFSGVHLIRMEKNRGYAAACNKAIEYCLENEAQQVLLLNNDVVVHPNILSEMTRVMEMQNSIGIVGPLVLYYHDKSRVFSAGGRFDRFTARNWAIDQGSQEVSRHRLPREVDYVSGCALLVRSDLFEKAGLMDTRYFMYYDEIDFCLRAKRAGYKIVSAPQAKLWHRVSASSAALSGFKEYYISRNRFVLQKKFLKKNREYLAFLAWFFTLGTPIHMVELILSYRSPNLLSAFVRGAADGIRLNIFDG